jgi:hypothetical protein
MKGFLKKNCFQKVEQLPINGKKLEQHIVGLNKLRQIENRYLQPVKIHQLFDYDSVEINCFMLEAGYFWPTSAFSVALNLICQSTAQSF